MWPHRWAQALSSNSPTPNKSLKSLALQGCSPAHRWVLFTLTGWYFQGPFSSCGPRQSSVPSEIHPAWCLPFLSASIPPWQPHLQWKWPWKPCHPWQRVWPGRRLQRRRTSAAAQGPPRLLCRRTGPSLAQLRRKRKRELSQQLFRRFNNVWVRLYTSSTNREAYSQHKCYLF